MKKRGVKKIVSLSLVLLLFLCFSAKSIAAKQTTDMYGNTEYYSFRYSGWAKFKPNFKVPSNPGYLLTKGKYVKQVCLTYKRGNRTLSRGCSSKASKKINKEYTVSVGAWDTINPNAPKTTFWVKWIYF